MPKTRKPPKNAVCDDCGDWMVNHSADGPCQCKMWHEETEEEKRADKVK